MACARAITLCICYVQLWLIKHLKTCASEPRLAFPSFASCMVCRLEKSRELSLCRDQLEARRQSTTLLADTAQGMYVQQTTSHLVWYMPTGPRSYTNPGRPRTVSPANCYRASHDDDLTKSPLRMMITNSNAGREERAQVQVDEP